MTKDQRTGKVFVDWSQNDRHKTTVAAYSLRARARPTVSTPVSWDEVSDALDARATTALLDLDAADVLDRVDDLGDLYAPDLDGDADPARRSRSVRLAWSSTGRVAIVTGASRGVGAATAVALAAAGVHGRLRGARHRRHAAAAPGHDRRDGAPDHAPPAVRRSRCRRTSRSTTRSSAWSRRRSRRFGRVDMLVNNAAITFPGDLELPMKRYDLIFDVNLRAPLVAIQAVVPDMRSRGEGSIVNVSSLAALNYFPGLMAYGMSKVALEHLTVARPPSSGRTGSPSTRSGSTSRSRPRGSSPTHRTSTTPTGSRPRSRPRGSAGCCGSRSRTRAATRAWRGSRAEHGIMASRVGRVAGSPSGAVTENPMQLDA